MFENDVNHIYYITDKKEVEVYQTFDEQFENKVEPKDLEEFNKKFYKL